MCSKYITTQLFGIKLVHTILALVFRRPVIFLWLSWVSIPSYSFVADYKLGTNFHCNLH